MWLECWLFLLVCCPATEDRQREEQCFDELDLSENCTQSGLPVWSSQCIDMLYSAFLLSCNTDIVFPLSLKYQTLKWQKALKDVESTIQFATQLLKHFFFLLYFFVTDKSWTLFLLHNREHLFYAFLLDFSWNFEQWLSVPRFKIHWSLYVIKELMKSAIFKNILIDCL